MELFASVLLAVQVVSSLSIIVLVLLQQGKGADMGSSFGGGSAGSLFGATGAANFLSRMTKWAAIIFFASTIGLAWASHHPTGSILDGGVMQGFDRQTPPAPTGSEVPGTSTQPSEVPGAAANPPAGAPTPQAPGENAASVPDVPAVPSVNGGAEPAPLSAAPQGTDAPAVPAAPDAPAADQSHDAAVQNN